VLTVLAPSERYAQERGRQHKKLTDWARQGLLQAARWLPGRRIVAVTDSGYAALDLLGSVRRRLSVVTRLRLDARLFDPAPPRKRRAVGRPRTVDRRQPTLARRLADPHTRWQAITVAHWYGGEDRRVEIATGTATWHHPGLPRVPLRWVLARDPAGEFKTQAFLCTDQNAAPADILAWFARRWAIEVTFGEARRHLGVETQRQWSDLAIARTTPVLLRPLLARDLVGRRAAQIAQTAALDRCLVWEGAHHVQRRAGLGASRPLGRGEFMHVPATARPRGSTQARAQPPDDTRLLRGLKAQTQAKEPVA